MFSFKFSSVNLVASWAGMGDIPIFTTMRSLRGLRPLRALSRFQGIKVSRPQLNTRRLHFKVGEGACSFTWLCGGELLLGKKYFLEHTLIKMCLTIWESGVVTINLKLEQCNN